MEPQIGITSENLAKVTDALNKILVDEYVLYSKTRNAYWSIESADFQNKHLFFESQYEELDEVIDSVAKRIRYYSTATLKRFLELTHFSGVLHSKNDSTGFITELLNDHQSLITYLRTSINVFAKDMKDPGVSNYVAGLMETHEKMAWMLRSQLR
jgi:starvation-inducible DNA-binding protein